MKKEYKTPLMETVSLKNNVQLMAGSPVTNSNPTWDNGYSDNSNPDDTDVDL